MNTDFLSTKMINKTLGNFLIKSWEKKKKRNAVI